MAFSREFIFPEREGIQGRESIFRRKRNSRARRIQEREFIFQRERAQKGGLVFKLGFQPPPQWWSWPIRSYAGLWLLLCFSTQSINQHVMASHIARILHALANYPFECSIIRIWYIWQEINQKKRFKLELSNSYIPNMTLTLKAYAIQY